MVYLCHRFANELGIIWKLQVSLGDKQSAPPLTLQCKMQNATTTHQAHEVLLLPFDPMNTTSTAANLDTISIWSAESRDSFRTYAATAEKISIFRAVVKAANAAENRAVNKMSSPSLVWVLHT